jgi:Tfp pilus assembly protein PilX
MTFLLTQWKLVVCAVLLALLGVQTMRLNHAHMERAQLEAQHAEAARKAEADARATERKWQDQANETTKAKDEQILNINARLADALGELRNRPSRPAGDVPSTSSTCKGTTGAGIYAEDAAVVIREAARADRLRTALAACYSQYDQIRGR